MWRQALNGVWVNIFDLIDAVNDGDLPPQMFESRTELSVYTIETDRLHQREKAKERGGGG